MKTPIVTINYNGSKDTLPMVDSLMKSEEIFSLVIVDNKSPREEELHIIEKSICEKYEVECRDIDYANETVVYAKELIIGDNSIYLLQADDNYGFAKGTNIGIKFALSYLEYESYIAILNNDTEVTTGFLGKVINGIEKNNLAAAMGTILYYGYEKPYIWSIGGPIDWIKAQGVHEHKNDVFEGSNEEYVVRQFISGCFTVFKREVLEEIGLLDEDYFFAGEEYQYSYDIGKKYRLGWIPSSVIYHKSLLDQGNGSSHRIADLCWQYNAYMVKIVFVNKNKGKIYKTMWHCLFKAYLNTKLKQRYLATPEYGMEGFLKLKHYLYQNINRTSFLYKDFVSFREG